MRELAKKHGRLVVWVPQDEGVEQVAEVIIANSPRPLQAITFGTNQWERASTIGSYTLSEGVRTPAMDVVVEDGWLLVFGGDGR